MLLYKYDKKLSFTYKKKEGLFYVYILDNYTCIIGKSFYIFWN